MPQLLHRRSERLKMPGTPGVLSACLLPIRATAPGVTGQSFFSGREAIVQFLTSKWNKELEYRLIKELWAFHGDRIAVRFAYEWHDDSGNWFRSYGNENWEFD